MEKIEKWLKEGRVEKQQQGDGPGFWTSRWSGPTDEPSVWLMYELLVWLMYEFSVAMIESEKVEIILQITKNYPLVEDKRKS